MPEGDDMRWAPWSGGDDEDIQLPWHLHALRIPLVWKLSRGSGVRVALIDTGLAAVNRLFREDTEYLDADGSVLGPEDIHGHGTACGTLIAGQWASAPGVAPESTLVSIRAGGADGKPVAGLVIRSIETAIRRECDILSCSFVVPQAPPDLLSLVASAIAAGVVVVAASGNDAAASGAFPEQVPGVVVVGALNRTGDPMDGRVGSWTDVFAPGERLRIVDCDGHITSQFGMSSGAAALVSGVTALALAAVPAAKRRQMGATIEQRIKNTAHCLPSSVALSETIRIIDPLKLVAELLG